MWVVEVVAVMVIVMVVVAEVVGCLVECVVVRCLSCGGLCVAGASRVLWVCLWVCALVVRFCAHGAV